MSLAASFLFLTPRAGVLVLLAALPLAALVIGARRVTRMRRLLGLPAPTAGRRRRHEATIVAVVALLALAATQPAIRTETPRRERTDAQAFVVVDVSRSMAAAPAASGPTRLARAKQIALALAPQFGDVSVGLATFTDRVLPDLFPTSDRATYDSAVSALTLESPPPREVNTVATTFDALQQVATEGFFAPGARKRAVIVVTDGESRPFDPRTVASALAAHGIRLGLVRVGSGADRVRRPDGTPEANFRPDPQGARLSISRLAAAAQAPTGPGAGAVLARSLGSGPSSVIGLQPRTRTLAPLPALLALVPLVLLLGGGSARRLLRGVTFGRPVASSRRARD
ncbi:MAG: hypothetical protein JWO17_3138 [Actinomycetia bacterium]|nr:hypothetical protein [Actinomycetes bacterium]